MLIYSKKVGDFVKSTIHTEAQRAEWLVYVVQYTAEELGMSVVDTTELLAKYGFIEKTLNGYPAFHTQGFEYMAEFLTGELIKVHGVLAQ
jgi:hypothetical protein